jgi:membrane associated rhomboid family serine protease
MQNTWSDQPGRGGGQLAFPSITPCVKRLLIATAGVFLLQFALSFGGPNFERGFARWLGLYPAAWKSWTPPVWQLLSYGFLHDVRGLGHILFNMLWLYFLGSMLEGIIGGRRFLAVYLGGMLAGGILQLAVTWGDAVPTVGASGAVLAITVAMATLRPQTTIIFLFFPLTLRTLAIIVVGMDVFGILVSLRDGAAGPTAYFAHLGGAVFGFVVAKRGLLWKDPFAEVARRLDERRERHQAHEQERVDELLDKIHREGIQSLSAREKAFLKRVSKR